MQRKGENLSREEGDSMIVRGTSRQLKHVALEWAISYNRGQYRPEKEASGPGMPTNIRSAVWKRKKLERGPKWLGRRAAEGEKEEEERNLKKEGVGGTL